MACCGPKANEETASKSGEVQEYYGKTLQSKDDLQTNACMLGSAVPKQHRKILSQIHEEVLDKFYGCGSPVPEALEGMTVLDLGCGTGRDVYLASALVGPTGSVIGVDMTDEQLDVARRHQDYQRKAFSHDVSNVRFVKGVIEDLRAVGIEDNSVDVVISNCVINLSSNKRAVFKEIFRILRPGGELYFSDVFADRRIPSQLQEDKVIWGECLSGALYQEDFRRMMNESGFPTFSVMSKSRITVDNPEIEKKCGPIQFHSILVRAFKLSQLEDRCEDYGQKATYLGTLVDQPHAFVLDPSHKFITGISERVCMNTASQLSKTRFAKYFKVSPPGRHMGLFPADMEGGVGSSACAEGACC